MSPIVSFSISESLKTFINKLVSKNQYENKSKLFRDALLRLMSTMDASDSLTDTSSIVMSTSKEIVGNMVIVLPNDSSIIRKINKIENEFKSQIVSKNQHFTRNNQQIIFIVFEGLLQDFQNIVVEINSIKEVKNFRYLILN